MVLRAPGLSFERVRAAYRPVGAAKETPILREALVVAAPGLLARWLEAEPPERARLAPAIDRYLVRMSSRPTPFGLFATVSLGSVGEHTRLQLAPLGEATRKSRLDMEVLVAVAQALALDEPLMWRLQFVPNDSLYDVGESFRYFQGHVKDGARRYTLEELEATSYLEATLERARSGATAGELAEALCDDDQGIGISDAKAFVRELIEEQVLVPAFEPPVTGEDPLAAMLEALGSTARDHPLVVALAACRRELEKMDRKGLGRDPDGYIRLEKHLTDAGLEVKREHLVQVDVFRPAEVIIGEWVVREVQRAVDVLRRITPSAAPEELT